MVEHVYDGGAFWTLPGGALEGDETAAEAAVRELREEAGLLGTAVRVLFDVDYSGGPDTCFLVAVDDDRVEVLGHDPELAADAQVLSRIRWFPLAEVADGRQVRLVIEALGR